MDQKPPNYLITQIHVMDFAGKRWATQTKKTTGYLSMKYWLFDKDPYVMVYEIIPT